MSNVAHVLEVAEGFAGQHEIGGNNCGPFVKECLASVGLPEGNPWCASFDNLVMVKAGVRGWPATGDTWALQTWARDHKCYSLVPQVGDVFLMIGGDGEPFHTGFVKQLLPNGLFSSIEGNTKATGVYTGPDGVHRRIHAIPSCKFIHWFLVLDKDKQPEDETYS